ncbi:MAG: substrate-binding domain-containing protein [bacterium]|nr:substrate-binding domain-containing protein [bacterium]
MRRGTLVIVVFVLLAAVIVGVSLFFRNQPPVQITIAVDPLAESWLRIMQREFNASDTRLANSRRVQVNLTVVNDLDVWRSPSWNTQNHPDGWLPSSTAAVTYANAELNNVLQTIQPSTGRTLLIWGGYASRVNALTEDGTMALDWERVITAAGVRQWTSLGGESRWGNLKLAFPLADRTAAGLAVLFSGAAAVADNPALTGGNTRSTEFQQDMQTVIDSVPNFNTIGADVAAFTARGLASVDIAIGPESQWLQNLSAITRNEAVMFSYPEYTFVFDFPLAAWQDANTPAETREAVEAFGAWLMQPEQQRAASRFGLRPAEGTPMEADDLFVGADQYGIQRNPALLNIVQPPDRSAAQSLIQWFSTAAR